MCKQPPTPYFFFFNDTATTEIYTLSLHDALPISSLAGTRSSASSATVGPRSYSWDETRNTRSEEHTSELQSQSNLVCRLLLEKKKNITATEVTNTPTGLSSILC